MSSLHNPNVMGVIGICLDANVTPYIILPYMAGIVMFTILVSNKNVINSITAGSLLSYLRKNKDILVLSKTSYPNSAVSSISFKDMFIHVFLHANFHKDTWYYERFAQDLFSDCERYGIYCTDRSYT